MSALEQPSRGSDVGLELTKANHFRFGYNGQSFNERQSPSDAWWVRYGQCARTPYDLRTECVLAAAELGQTVKSDLWLCLSGGIDSEVMAQSFLDAGVPVRAAILRFADDLNLHDISWAISYCETHGLPYRLFDLDFRAFVRSGEYLHYADLSKCLIPALPSTMYLMDQIARLGGYAVLGSAECYLEQTDAGWVMYERETIAALYRYVIATKQPAQAGFFQWNPEMMLAFLRHPIVQRLVHGLMPNAKGTAKLKPALYGHYWPMLSRPKYTGFETLLREYADMRVVLGERYAMYKEEAKVPLAELYAMLQPH